MRSLLSIVIFAAVVWASACWSTPVSNDMPASTPNAESRASSSFLAAIAKSVAPPKNDVERRLLSEYGSVFVARGGVKPPPKIIFSDENDVAAFQDSVDVRRENVSGVTIELQSSAMTALLAARDEAKLRKLSITPRGVDAARRSYADTVELWKSRVEPALNYWTGQGKIDKSDADRIRALSPVDQIPEVFALEAKGFYFSKDFSKSIIYSVAPPGSSQHLSMLAVDLEEYDNSETRRILAQYGWFQTVKSDLPHFTFLGVKESEMSSLGLKAEEVAGRKFWVPDTAYGQ